MIEAAAGPKLEKMICVVTIVALGFGRPMKLRFADGLHTIVAFAAITKNFLMIDKRDERESQRCVTSLAGVAGGEMIG